MPRRTITITDETWRNLNTMKYALLCDTVDDLLRKLILNYQIKTKKEIK